MVYIYKKTIGNKAYYYLRASVRKNGKIAIKDIAYLGSDISDIKAKLANVPKEYTNEIRKTYRTINRFIEVNKFLEDVKSLKLKKDDYLKKDSLAQVEACKQHWNKVFMRLDELTKEEALKAFIIEFAFNTASIEGNTITLKQAHDLLVEKLTPKNKTLREIYDLQNTEKVFQEIFHKKPETISHEFICEIHDALLENIDARKGYRTEDVRVFRSRFKSTPAAFVKTDMELLVKWYRDNVKKMNPFVLATVFHHKFEKIHPFMDGNGRTGRMLMNYILLKHDYAPLIIRKKNRARYLEQLHKADKAALTEHSPEDYKHIIEFNAKELSDTYWNVFL